MTQTTLINPKSLVPRIELLPEKREQKDLVAYLSAYADDMQAHAAARRPDQGEWSLAAVAAACPLARRAVPDLPLADAAGHVARGAEAAARLRALVAADVKDIKTDAARNLVVTVKEQAAAADRRLRESWRQRLEAYGADYLELAAALERAAVPGARDLATAAQRVRAHGAAPPVTEKAADAVRSDLQVLVLAAEKLGLDPEARQFIVAVANGRGVPLKAVLTPAVQKLLGTFPQLNEVLRVTLR